MDVNASPFPLPQPGPDGLWPRDLFLTILRSALAGGDTRFARLSALAWLGVFPGDLPITLLYAQALVNERRPEQALPVLEELLETDPEYRDAIQLLASIHAKSSRRKGLDPSGYLAALGEDQRSAQKGLAEQTEVAWSRFIGQARVFHESGDLTRAEQAMHQALASRPSNPLMATTHLKILLSQTQAQVMPPQALLDLAEYYHNCWPGCLQCSLLLADALMDGGESEKAVALLHQAATRDVTGQVTTRLWGQNHPYRSLWPDRLVAHLELAVPANVAASLGWNRLPAGGGQGVTWTEGGSSGSGLPKSKSSASHEAGSLFDLPFDLLPKSVQNSEGTGPGSTDRPKIYVPVPEALRSVQAELERVAERINRPSLARSDGRLPVYVIMTTRRGLENAYGPENFATLDAEMRRLLEAVQARRDWRAVLFYADDGVSTLGKKSHLAIQPARPADPWSLKLALADLDSALGKKGEMIGAVLIVGGPDIVPFHRLPNPVDDLDEEVLSDNPYGTRDENYFVPEWPVGRLPGGTDRDGKGAGLLLKSLRGLTGQHMAYAQQRRSRPWYRKWGEGMAAWLKNRSTRQGRKRNSFGYTAAIWRQASFSVFQPIGQPNAMLVSPPVQAPLTGDANPESSSPQPLKGRRPIIRKPRRKIHPIVPPARMAYFNLHGLEDAVEWYGQRDPSDSGPDGAGLDYPVALRPQDIVNGGRAPQVVFSEACYGAHILGKSIEEALALKFLHSGSQAVVGSTCTAYGSVSIPLIAADYLGQSFWNYLRRGLPAGEALRRSKIALAHEMHLRQGYLDGEDQKTLISFILYGDPLALPLGIRNSKSPKEVWRPLEPPSAVQTICDRACCEQNTGGMPPEVIAKVKSVVEQYLPGMTGAQMSVSSEHAGCKQAGHNCPTAQLLSKSTLKKPPRRRLVTLSKQVPVDKHLHTHYARLTLDQENRLVKLVVSR